jgi:hypothetical protein
MVVQVVVLVVARRWELQTLQEQELRDKVLLAVTVEMPTALVLQQNGVAVAVAVLAQLVLQVH